MKKYLVLIIAFIMFGFGVLMLTPPRDTGVIMASPGSAQNPFVINSGAELNLSLTRSRFGQANTHHVLGGDIDLSAFTNWVPIPLLASGSVLDGNGYTITGLTTNRAGSNIGLFDMMNGGTVRNLNFEGVVLNFSGAWNVAGIVAARVTGGSNRIENVEIVDGTVGNTTANTVGGLVGEISAGIIAFDTVLNNADVSGSHWLGGIIGRIRGSGNVSMLRTGNTGAVTSHRVGESHTGGLAGIVEGQSSLSVDWSFNSGAITAQRGNAAGILGVAWAGMVEIRNTINDSVINIATITGNRAGITTRNGTAGVQLYNNWFNSNLAPGLLIVTGVAGTGVSERAGLPSSGPRTQAQLHNTQFLEDLNSGADGFIVRGGRITHSAFVPVFTYTFTNGGHSAVGAPIVIRQPIEDVAGGITLPHTGMSGITMPTRAGFAFRYWSDGTTHNLLPGSHFVNGTDQDITFTAVFHALIFDVVIEQDINVSATGPSTIQINQSPLTLTATSWNPGMFWLARTADGQSYTNLGDAISIDFSSRLNEMAFGGDFINRHMVFDDASTTAGRLYIRVASNATATILDVAGNQGGSLTFTVGNDPALTVNVGSRVSLPIAGMITSLQANPSAHFEFVSFVLEDEAGGYVITFDYQNGVDEYGFLDVTELTAAESDYFNLSDMQGWTINVNFIAIEFTFSVTTSFGEHPPIEGIVTYDDLAVIIGDDFDFTAHALPAVQGYRFVAWRIRTSVGYERMTAGATTFTWEREDIDNVFLLRYAIGRQITIVAEYVQTHRLNVAVADGQYGFGALHITVLDPNTRETSNFRNIENLEVVSGTIVYIIASETSRYHSFGQFLGLQEEMAMGLSVQLTVTSNRNIQANFVTRDFTIVFESWENENRLRGIGEFDARVNGIETDELTVADTLNAARINPDTPTPGHRFVNFTITNEEGETVELGENTAITLDLIQANFTLPSNFVIRANFVRVFALSITVAEISQGMGSYQVFIDEETDATLDREFELGTTVNVVVQVNDFHMLPNNAFTGVRDGEVVQDTITINQMTTSRSIIIRFAPLTFDLEYELTADRDGELLIDRTEGIQTGERIILTVSTPNGRRIRNWRVNNIDLTNPIGLPSNVFVAGNTAIITMDAAWLTAHDFELVSHVDFRLTLAVLIAILLPGIVVPLLAFAAIWYLSSSKKKYASIKAELISENRHRVAFDKSGLIRDLRDGKVVGQVTKQDIKKKMKEKKGK